MFKTRQFVCLILAIIATVPSLIATKPPASPEAVVQAQVDAYNAHNLDAFVASYADDAQLFLHPDKPFATGSAEIRDRYQNSFKNPNLHVSIANRIVMGDKVIDHERVTQTGAIGSAVLEGIVIYEVQNGKIAKAWLITGPKTVTPKPAAGKQ